MTDYSVVSSKSIYDKSQDRTETGRGEAAEAVSLERDRIHSAVQQSFTSFTSPSHPSAGMGPVSGLWVVGDSLVELVVLLPGSQALVSESRWSIGISL